MAVVGEAHIIVRALTDKVAGDIQRGFSGTGAAGAKAGENMGQAFTRGFNKNANANIFTKFSNGLKTMVPDAEAAYQSFRKLVTKGYEFGTAIALVIGTLSSLVGGIVSLGGAALGASASIAVLGNVFSAMGLAMISARLALSGVGKALAALNKGAAGGSNAAAILQAQAAAAERVADAEQNLATVIENNREALVNANNDVRDSQLELNKAIIKGQEEIQQLGFDAEDAALSESKAALELDKARETLARTQDLPPNSRARKEAELAFQEAELNLRKAKDRSADLNKEQDRLARTGVSGTEAVINANQRLAQAQSAKDKVVRDGLRSQAKAEADLAKAKAAAASAGADAGGGGADPFAGLNEAQVTFVRFLASLKPQFDGLKASLSAALLPPLQEAITTLMNGAFPVVKQGLTLVAAATGEAAKSFANAVVEATNLANLKTLFESSSRIIDSLGRSAGSLWGAVLSVLTAVAPMAERFVGFIETALAKFDGYLKSTDGQDALIGFFNRVEENAKLVGDILGNVFGGLGALIQANTGPGTGGYMLLTWLKEATSGFADMGKGAEGAKLKQFFQGVAENIPPIMSAIGELVKELGGLGDNPAIGKTFAALERGAPFVGDILEKTIEAGPVVGEFVATLFEIGAAFADTESIQVFFGVLQEAATWVTNFLKDDTASEFVRISGLVLAFSLALGKVWDVAKLGVGIVANALGNIGTAFSVLGKIVSGYYFKKTFLWAKDVAETIYLKALYAKDHAVKIAMWAKEKAVLVADAAVRTGIWVKESALKLGLWAKERAVMVADAAVRGAMWAKDLAAMALQKGAMLAGAAVTGIVTAAQWAWNAAMTANPIGLIIVAIAALIAGLVLLIANWDAVVKFLGDAWNNFVAWITPGLEAFGAWWNGMWEAVGKFISDVWNNIVNFVVDAWNNIWGFIGPAIDGFFGWWNGLWASVGQFIADTWNNIVNFFSTGWEMVWRFILSAVVNYYSWWFGIFGAIGKFIGDVWTNITNFFRDGWNGVVNWITGAINNFVGFWQRAFSGIGSFVGSVFNGIVGVVKGPINMIIDLINGMISRINSIKIDIPPFARWMFGGQSRLGFSIPTIPRLAMGGVVAPSSGGTLAQIAEAGKPERVEPLDQNGMSKRDKYMMNLIKAQQGNAGTINITVNPAPGMDERELAAAISREISFQMRRGAVA